MKQKLIQLGLFLLTIVTTTIAGAEWTYGSSFIDSFRPMGWSQFFDGFHYSIPFLLFLTVHEFGHYFMAKYHRIDVSLPTYIPFWFGNMTSLGTMGAFIKIKDKIEDKKKYFDVGIAGPLAGFVIAIGVLIYGFTHLPPLAYLFKIHPEYQVYGEDYAKFVYQKNQAGQVALGENLLFTFLKNNLVELKNLLPHPNEMIHYPYLMAGYLGLFFTSLNLIPIGQLDGGHILFGLIGKKNHDKVSAVLFVLYMTYFGIGTHSIEEFKNGSTENFIYSVLATGIYIYFLMISFTSLTQNKEIRAILALSIFLIQLAIHYFFKLEGYSGLLLFGFVIGRFLGVYHPETKENDALDMKRIILGILALIIFILTFSFNPFVIS